LDKRTIHELAVAYAQIALYDMRKDGRENSRADMSGTDEEIYHFVKAYRFALDNIENAWDDIG